MSRARGWRIGCRSALTVVAIGLGAALSGMPAVATPSQPGGPPIGHLTGKPGAVASISILRQNELWAIWSNFSFGRGGEPYGRTEPLHKDPTWLPSPTPSLRHLHLRSIAASTSSDAWAVGGYYVPPSGLSDGHWLPVALHWTGGEWATSDLPLAPDANGADLYSVDALSPTNVWAAGQAPDRSRSGMILLHWTGTSWTRLPNPRGAGLDRVWALSFDRARDGWAAAGGSVLHWDGTTWATAYTLPRRRSVQYVAAVSPTNVWASGSGVYHYNGKRWTAVATTGGRGWFGALTTPSPRHVWVWSNLCPQHRRCQKVLLRGTGNTWGTVRMPTRYPNIEISSLASAGPRSVWVVGSYRAKHSRPHILALRWNGNHWRAS